MRRVDFPETLRLRRTRRHLSQLDLALRAGTTQRHLSFLESGRSEPGRALVIRLAESLELPLRERNSLLAAAGYAPAYPQTPLADAALAPVREALGHVLRAHEPYPALIADRYGGLVAGNRALALLTDGAAAGLTSPGMNVYRLALHPAGMAPRIANFAQWARHVIEALHAELMRNPDHRLAELYAELERYVPDEPLRADHLGFAVPLQLRTGDGPVALITTITSFATATDVTISELKLEAFLPADQASARILARRAAAGGPDGGEPAGGELLGRADGAGW
jgi:transcriptional regulator with XRE-family HTH domain